MEIEIRPISLDARLEYLQNIAENQQRNIKKFPWSIAVICFIIGAGVGYTVFYYQRRREEKARAGT